ncbi:MAG: urea transporter, partial [Planctomycetes bacterium]|nr:urea transporter [Planctomycetota bacterium]
MADSAASSPRFGEDFYRSFLVGYGALFFAPHPASGALFLLATFAANPALGTGVLLGILSATWTAHFLRRSRFELEHGLYGFNGALAAFAVFSLQGDAGALYGWTAVCAALTVPITMALMDGAWSQRFGLPALSIPSLVIGFPVLFALTRWTELETVPGLLLPAHLSSQALFDGAYYTSEMFQASVGATPSGSMALLFALGLAIYSKRFLLKVVLGVCVSTLVGFLFLGWYGAFDFGFVWVAGLPTFVAVGVVFTGRGLRSFGLGVVGVLLAFALWFSSGLWLVDLELPQLTAPFCLSTVALLGGLRSMGLKRPAFLPELIPLHQIGPPARVSEWAAQRASGWRYWEELAGRIQGTWEEYTTAEKLARARDLVRKSRKIVVITGAGVSTESGIPDYRTGAVAWKQYDTSHFRFERFMASEVSREEYWKMSQDFYLVLRNARANAGHVALAELDKLGKLEAIITQNVDRLHQMAGVDPSRVIEIHGNEQGVTCLKCGRKYTRDEVYDWIVSGVQVPYCTGCQGILKPDSVAFGQPMLEGESRRA